MRSAVAPRAILGTPRSPARRAASVVTGTRASTAAAAARGSPFLAGRASTSTSPRGGRGGSLRASRAARRSPGRRNTEAAALPPNKEWPPNDVWSEFRATHSGTWSGFAARFRFDGAPVGWATGEVAPAPQWRRTRASSAFAGPAKIQDVDSLEIETTYFEDDRTIADAEINKKPSETFKSTLLAGGQMGKMCVAQGDFFSGPTLLPKCEAGATTKFELGFTIRVPERYDGNGGGGDYGDGELEPWDVRFSTNATPTERVRIVIDVLADPGAKRNWRARSFTMLVERKDGSAHDTLLRDELFGGDSVEQSSSYLGEDDLASGDFRAVAGATFLTCESLLDDAAFEEFWLETFRAEREAREKKASASGARARRAGKGGSLPGSRKARGVAVKKDGDDAFKSSSVSRTEGDQTETETETEPEAESPEAKRRKEEDERRAREDALLRSLPKPAPDGLVVVPTWAARAKAQLTSAHEYLVGGQSPLVLLPRRTWVLVESVGDELLVEAGAYAGEKGLGFSDFLSDDDDVGGGGGGREASLKNTPRRAVARRYERGGRFASAFFVEEREMTKAELDDELEEGEGGKPLTF